MSQYEVIFANKKKLPMGYAYESGNNLYSSHLVNLNNIYKKDFQKEMEIQKGRDLVSRSVSKSKLENIKTKYKSIEIQKLSNHNQYNSSTTLQRIASAIKVNPNKEHLKTETSKDKKNTVQLEAGRNFTKETKRIYQKSKNFRSDLSPYQKYYLDVCNTKMFGRIKGQKAHLDTKMILSQGDKLLSFKKNLQSNNVSERMKEIPKLLQTQLQENKRKVYKKLGRSFDDTKFDDTKSKYSLANTRILSAITDRTIRKT